MSGADHRQGSGDRQWLERTGLPGIGEGSRDWDSRGRVAVNSRFGHGINHRAADRARDVFGLAGANGCAARALLNLRPLQVQRHTAIRCKLLVLLNIS